MLNLKSLFKSFVIFTISIVLLSACQENDSLNFPESDSENIEALKKLINDDEIFDSFEANFSDDAMMNSLAKSNNEIEPTKVRRQITNVEKNVDLDISEDELTATGVITKTITGKLLITVVDDQETESVIEKEFISVVTRNVEFEKYNNSKRPDKNWRITRISLAEGNTGSDNVEILKLTLFMPDGSTIEIDSPNDYYLERVVGMKNQVPNMKQSEEITVRAEIRSDYDGDDLVNLRYGATRKGLKRAKKSFELVETTTDGIKIYEASYKTNQTKGKKHAVVSVVSHSTIHDSEAPVESNSWGIPYVVN